MPFWRRRYRYRPYRWRRRRYPTWRPRKVVRRTFWRRRRRVRKRKFKRKLKNIFVKQFQPQSIKRLTVKGYYQMFFTTNERTNHNNTLYIDSTTPFHVHGGGGFSLTQMTLNNLYDQHLRLRNWWTKSNDTYPLIRYMGVTVYLYYQQNFDYIFSYNNCFPMKCSRICYNATQPMAMMLMKHRKIVQCKNYNRKRKPYRKLFIKPPPQLKNQWYFQHNLADIPLVNFMCTAASLDRMYAPSNAVTTTVRFYTLNAQFFTSHLFKYRTTSGYTPKPNRPLFAAPEAHTYAEIKFEDLIYLGNAFDYGPGTEIKNVMPNTNTEARWNKYFTESAHWGNPFLQNYLDHTQMTIQSTVPLSELKQFLQSKNYNFQTKLTEFGNKLAEVKTPYILEVRYNPHKDKGKDNEVYILHIDNKGYEGWEPEPNKPEYISRDLPLWTLLWGLSDWYTISGQISSADTHSLIVIKTKYFEPKEEAYYVLLGEHFLTGRSPYFPFSNDHSEPERNSADNENWHPKLNFQKEVFNIICSTGPGVIKLNKDQSAEAHIQYKFHFKLGGCPPPMELIVNPQEQPIWTIPSNFNDQPSLQSPGTPFEHFLYHFDQRGDYLTKRAIKRLQKDYPTKETIPSITGSTGLNIPPEKTQESDSEASTEEKEQEALFQQLQLHYKQHKQLRHRINQLLRQLTTTEYANV
nr:MAG: ORF1 [TTV-like mini virus]